MNQTVPQHQPQINNASYPNQVYGDGCPQCARTLAQQQQNYQSTGYLNQSVPPFINRSRITPVDLSILGHSNIKNEQIKTNSMNQSMQFQSQRRVTYQPYLRKYIDYQEYIQYVPVEKNHWDFQKVVKQIDFQPRKYVQTEIQYYPKQTIQSKLRYIPVQQQIIHLPEQLIAEKRIVKKQVTIEEAQRLQRNGKKQATQLSSQRPFATSSSSSFITHEPSNVIRPSQYRQSQVVTRFANLHPSQISNPSVQLARSTYHVISKQNFNQLPPNNVDFNNGKFNILNAFGPAASQQSYRQSDFHEQSPYLIKKDSLVNKILNQSFDQKIYQQK